MDFQTYKQERDRLIAGNPDLIRLDCMNVYKALEKLKKTTEEGVLYSAPACVQTYKDHLGFPADLSLTAVAEGVVRTLETVFAQMSKHDPDAKFFFPKDVYPVYNKINRHKNTRYYETIGSFSFPEEAFLGKDAKLFLLTYPLKPSCYGIEAEKLKLLQWLEQNEKHALVIDGVYSYEYPREIDELIRHSRCVWVSSLSKAFLSPKVMGVAKVSDQMKVLNLDENIANLDEPSKILAANKELPKIQLQLFTKTWETILEQLPFLRTHIDVSPSYLKTVPISYEELLREKKVLAVPASVFGSEKNYSVISCLLPLQNTFK